MSLSATSTVLSGGVVSEGIKQRIVVSILWKAELVSDVCQSGKFLHKTFHGCCSVSGHHQSHSAAAWGRGGASTTWNILAAFIHLSV